MDEPTVTNASQDMPRQIIGISFAGVCMEHHDVCMKVVQSTAAGREITTCTCQPRTLRHHSKQGAITGCNSARALQLPHATPLVQESYPSQPAAHNTMHLRQGARPGFTCHARLRMGCLGAQSALCGTMLMDIATSAQVLAPQSLMMHCWT